MDGVFVDMIFYGPGLTESETARLRSLENRLRAECSGNDCPACIPVDYGDNRCHIFEVADRAARLPPSSAMTAKDAHETSSYTWLN